MHQPYGLTDLQTRRSDYDIRIQDCPNATVWPVDEFKIPKPGIAGISGRDGMPIREAGLERGGGVLLSCPQGADHTSVEFRDQEVILGGYIAHHYGHFLLESLARLWGYRDSSLPVVWAAGRQFTDWELSLFDLLGVARNRLIALRQPVRFARIHVPTPGFIIRRNFHERQRDALAVTPCAPGKARVYLSRSSFKSRLFTASGESAVEDILAGRGWQIIRPETLPISEQVAILANAAVVAGIEGSAFHTLMLCAKPQARVIVLRRQNTNANYDTIASTIGLDQRDMRGWVVNDPADDRFATLRHPAKCAARIIELAAS
ncbi:glycosyltransferase 61 family protein [Paracoccus sp. DMF-8]|uniref:glycosyltransferase family 61 protein n=1 Tax=Paracoccus sp. DMF-8 TaxID=3019445 RepID=UPI0023E7A833|nr:glycosyltransferase 61 family protein [Paracoccus sp. DMF-8]MDF3605878.1 glycosyltransferase 61 family protein [Paracoccus sp. DMF-8]